MPMHCTCSTLRRRAGTHAAACPAVTGRAHPAPGTIADRDGRPIHAGARPDQYPLTAVDADTGATIYCADATADWTDDRRAVGAATDEQVRELAAAIAAQADAIATGRLVGPIRGAVIRLAENVATLQAWTS